MRFKFGIVSNPLENAQNLSERYALEAYKVVSRIYPSDSAETIKQSSTLTGNEIKVDGFLANAFFKGKESYSLAEGLLSSKKAKESSTGTKYLTVPIQEEFRTLTEKSQGWIHPGFPKEFYEEWEDFVLSQEIIDLVLNTI